MQKLTKHFSTKRTPQSDKLCAEQARMRSGGYVKEMVRLISDHGLPHECVPNTMKQHASVWEALLERMPVGAMIRNLNKMTAVGLLTNSSGATARVREALSDLERLRRARVHPLSVLVALRTYTRGEGFKGSMSWSPVGRIVDALDGAFYLAFGAVEPTGKRLCLALDVSGSMTSAVSGARVQPLPRGGRGHGAGHRRGGAEP